MDLGHYLFSGSVLQTSGLWQPSQPPPPLHTHPPQKAEQIKVGLFWAKADRMSSRGAAPHPPPTKVRRLSSLLPARNFSILEAPLKPFWSSLLVHHLYLFSFISPSHSKPLPGHTEGWQWWPLPSVGDGEGSPSRAWPQSTAPSEDLSEGESPRETLGGDLQRGPAAWQYLQLEMVWGLKLLKLDHQEMAAGSGRTFPERLERAF